MSDATNVEADYEALLSFLYVAPVGLLEIDPSGAISMMNPLGAQLLLPVAGAGGISNLFDALGSHAPDLRNFVSSFAGERGTICEARRIHIRSLDSAEPQILACSLIKIDNQRIMGVLNDVTAQVLQERRLQQAESWFSIMLSGVNDFALLSLNANGRVQSWNKSGERLTGHSARDIQGHTLNVLYPPAEAIQGRALQQIDFARRDGWHIDEGWRKRKDGTRFWCQSLVSALEEQTGEVSGYSVVLRDVTEQKTSGDEIRRLLTTDKLTGVMNRAHFFELAEAEIVRCQRFGSTLSALMVDIDHFKQVNDTFGHAGGDEVLRQLGQHFRTTLRSIDLVGRLGGEEFAVLLPSIDVEGAKLLAELFRGGASAIRASVDGSPVGFTVSIGCAQLGAETRTIDELLKAADGALYEAKRTGRNRVVAHGGAEGPERQRVA
ncbi:diguanylate cyclase [uncultured Enterovirga sp.]|uniref:sensor domain-containing diguanylate cyclase n=1 Tax=uncultured Enterovirga sp. TaxID=2026352 RepID=UPI0035C9E8E6